MTVPFGVSGVKREDIMEECRQKLVSAMKTGGTFALYLGQVSIEHADFKTKLCKKVLSSYVPILRICIFLSITLHL